VRDAVGGAVDDAVDDAVDGAVRGAVDGAVRDAVGGADQIRRGTWRAISSRWYYYLAPAWWTSRWWGCAYTSFFRDICDLELPGDLWDRAKAYEQTAEAGSWWWPTKHFVMVADRPNEIHLEQFGPRGWGSHRLHNETGPAISWSDGTAYWFVHGTRVTEQIVLHPETLTIAQILAEPNAEVRRVMLDRFGWTLFAEQAQLRLVDEAPDPANAPHTIRLYDLPTQIFGEPVRLLLCTNGTPERDGTRRQFGLTTPATCETALAAAGWTYGLSAKQYAGLARRT
jgi:hypothetical protein